MSDMDGLMAELRTLHATLERTGRLSPEYISEVASQAADTLVMRVGNMPQYSADDNNNFLDEFEHVASSFGSDNIAAITRAGNNKALKAGVTTKSRNNKAPMRDDEQVQRFEKRTRFVRTLRRVIG